MRATCLILLGRTDEARQLVERVLSTAENQGAQSLWGYCLAKLAACQMVAGSLVQARTTLKRALDYPSTAPNKMMIYELNSDLALAVASAGDAVGAQAVLDHSPSYPGLSIWASLGRLQAQAAVALVHGDAQRAQAFADELALQAKDYPVYRWRAERLVDAIQDPPPSAMLPSYFWRSPSADTNA